MREPFICTGKVTQGPEFLAPWERSGVRGYRPTTASIAARVLEIRIARDLSQKELAAAIGQPRTYVSKVECSRVVPSPETLVRLAAALCVPVDVLIEPDEMVALSIVALRGPHGAEFRRIVEALG